MVDYGHFISTYRRIVARAIATGSNSIQISVERAPGGIFQQKLSPNLVASLDVRGMEEPEIYTLVEILAKILKRQGKHVEIIET